MISSFFFGDNNSIMGEQQPNQLNTTDKLIINSP